MNEITRIATPEETAEASQIILSQAELDRMFADAQAARSREAARQNRARWARISLLVALSGAVIAEGAALAAIAPTVRVVPVFVYLRDDGTSTTSQSWLDMPADVREANLLNVIAEYVRLREGWSPGEAEYAWDTVSAMSGRDVREQFQSEWIKTNPASPQRVLGDHATVRVKVSDVRKESDTEGAWRVYFTSTKRSPDSNGIPKPMVATLRVRSVSDPKTLPWDQRIAFNGPAIQVVEYPGAVPNGPGGSK